MIKPGFFILLFSIVVLPVALQAQIDREFWFVGPEAASNHGDRPVYIRISTMEDPANITLRMPANLNFTPIVQSIAPNSTISIQLDNIKGNNTWLDSIENRPADQVLRKGLLLTSDAYVTAYYEINNGSNPAIFPLKGKNGVGTEFYIPGQSDYPNQVNDGSEAFDIVATEDNTVVTITPSLDIVGHAAGVPFQVTLQKGQTYSARTLNTSASATLAGSHVASNKPIAITISDDSIITGGWDIIGDQIIPVNLLGTSHTVIKGFAHNVPPNNNDERIYILATQDATSVYIDGSAIPAVVLNTGQQYDYDIPPASNTTHVKTSMPAYVYHLTGHPGESGASVIPHDSCTGSRSIGFNRSSANAFALLILTRNGNQDHFLLNGGTTVVTGAAFNVVPGTNDEWVYFRQNNLTTGQVPIGANYLENTQGKFHLGILNNVAASSEYGYFSDFSTLYLGADANMCPGDSILLDGGPFRDTYDWKRLVAGNWTQVGASRFYTVTDTGYYACVTNGDLCLLMDTIHVTYYPGATVSLGNDRTICEGTTTTFSPGAYVTYLWNDNTSEPTLTTGTEGQKWVVVTNNNGCVASDTVMVQVDSLPLANQPITGPPEVCQGAQNVSFQVGNLTYAASYAWTLPPGATGASTTNQITLGFSTGATSGILAVKGINACGEGPPISFTVNIAPLPGPPGAISGPAMVCPGAVGLQFSVGTALYASSYSWTLPPGFTITSGAGTATITISTSTNPSAGTITVIGQNSCGTGPSGNSPVGIKAMPAQPTSVSGDFEVCQGDQNIPFTIVNPDPNTTSYTWNFMPPAAGSITGSGTTGTVSLAPAFFGNAFITVQGNNECGTGAWSPSFSLAIRPLPVVTYTACHDVMTTKNARPVLLRGGNPLGMPGVYSGPGVSQTSPGVFVFDPSDPEILSSPGGVPYTIVYEYTNTYGCKAQSQLTMKVFLTNAAAPCPGSVTDVRDGHTYSTFLGGSGGGSRCWMAENLNYGVFTNNQTPHTDNCIIEKYCVSNQSGRCDTDGGYYQWKEVMDYTDAAGSKGICPPGWHIPTQADWTALLDYYLGAGVSGGAMRDMNRQYGFHGLLGGIFYQAYSWNFTSPPMQGSMFWSSSSPGPEKANAYGINSYNPSTSRYPAGKGNAFPVRCVRD